VSDQGSRDGARDSAGPATVSKPPAEGGSNLKGVIAFIGAVAGLITAIAGLVKVCNPSDSDGPDRQATASPSRPTPANTPAPIASAAPAPPSGAETVMVPWYGALTVGGPCDQAEYSRPVPKCRGKTPSCTMTDVFNCDASGRKRVQCQNGMVRVEVCPRACVQNGQGLSDRCE
jgi:hypothetical protein